MNKIETTKDHTNIGISLFNLKNFERISEFESQNDNIQIPYQTRRAKTLKGNREASLRKSQGIKLHKVSAKASSSKPTQIQSLFTNTVSILEEINLKQEQRKSHIRTPSQQIFGDLILAVQQIINQNTPSLVPSQPIMKHKPILQNIENQKLLQQQFENISPIHKTSRIIRITSKDCDPVTRQRRVLQPRNQN